MKKNNHDEFFQEIMKSFLKSKDNDLDHTCSLIYNFLWEETKKTPHLRRVIIEDLEYYFEKKKVKHELTVRTNQRTHECAV